jgi:hypothetical protein
LPPGAARRLPTIKLMPMPLAVSPK